MKPLYATFLGLAISLPLGGCSDDTQQRDISARNQTQNSSKQNKKQNTSTDRDTNEGDKGSNISDLDAEAGKWLSEVELAEAKTDQESGKGRQDRKVRPPLPLDVFFILGDVKTTMVDLSELNPCQPDKTIYEDMKTAIEKARSESESAEDLRSAMKQKHEEFKDRIDQDRERMQQCMEANGEGFSEVVSEMKNVAGACLVVPPPPPGHSGDLPPPPPPADLPAEERARFEAMKAEYIQKNEAKAQTVECQGALAEARTLIDSKQ